ncbi:MAG: ATP12 family protein [Alphaproteobacteria bacterium]
MSQWKAKKYWQAVRIKAEESGFVVLLDEKTLLSPQKRPLLLTTEALAEAVAAEWRQQEGDINHKLMPLTALANTEIDGIAPDRQGVIAGIIQAAHADVLCYWDSIGSPLHQQQQQYWQPWLQQAATLWGLSFATTHELRVIMQPPVLVATLTALLEQYSTPQITVLQAVLAATSSVIVALFFTANIMSPDEVLHCALLEEIYQAEKWGKDEWASMGRAHLLKDIEQAAYYRDLTKTIFSDKPEAICKEI